MTRPTSRGFILALLGAAWVLQSAAIAAGVWQPIPTPDLHETIPVLVKVHVWGLSGLAALVAAPMRRKWWGFAAANVIPPGMVVLWVAAALMGADVVRAIFSASTWAIVTALIGVASIPCRCEREARP